ncbi:MAG: L,D-transpeptidase family protein [Lachnospiraceae bacterium]|nr:L,D-transpeptidase family protein [Lachnospiraceae bacterium]
MAKMVWKITGIVIGCLLLGAGIIYLAVAFYFQQKFLPNTVISSHLVEGMDVDTVNALLQKDMREYELTLLLQDGESETIPGADFDHETDFSKDLFRIQQSQNPYEWGWYFLYPTSYSAKAEVGFDEGKLFDLLSALPCYHIKDENAKATVKIENRMNHFTFRDDRRDVLNTERATETVVTAVAEGSAECDLKMLYEAPGATAKQQKELDRWKEVEKVQNACITFSDGDLEIVADRHVYAPWFVLGADGLPKIDANGDVMLDEEQIGAFVTRLSDTFNTDKRKRKWQKYKGGEVELSYGKAGFVVDEEAEAEAIPKTILKGWKEVRRPLYSQEGAGHGNDEVGDTYVEVDLSNQKLYFFEKGELKLESDIVTGCKRYHNDTPSMITDIYYMQKNRVLHGENYATFVYYWMAFYRHYGLHDATWRSKFGGDIYLTDGSHGCVNMPKEKAAELYDMVYVGMPVVLYE